jgi:hypothetical protein
VVEIGRPQIKRSVACRSLVGPYCISIINAPCLIWQKPVPIIATKLSEIRDLTKPNIAKTNAKIPKLEDWHPKHHLERLTNGIRPGMPSSTIRLYRKAMP